jgi:hypothetical protein
MTALKLLALDSADLSVISAHVQDAVVRVGDMGYAKGDHRFALIINRYDWESGTVRNKGLRKRAALHFDRVLAVASTGINTNARDGVLELLAITFTETDAPAGTVELTFAGGGAIRLTVECLEARLEDLGAAWAARAQPRHAL